MSQISNSAVHKANIVNLSQSGLVQFYYIKIDAHDNRYVCTYFRMCWLC